MATVGPAAEPKAAVHGHGFHPLRVARVVRETDDASSFVLDVPSDLEEAFSYRAGQFCTFRIWVDGQPHHRCYSMSSSPDVDGDLTVTVKRVPGGTVSNWIIDTLEAGHVIDTSCPAGVFCLGAGEGEVVAFAAGSGITPVHSILKTALATTSRSVRLLYANRDRDSVIFGEELARLQELHPGRLEVTNHLDVGTGFVGDEDVRAFAGADAGNAEHFICGPEPFMNIVESTLIAGGVVDKRIRIERFTPAEPELAAEPSRGSETQTVVTIDLDGRSESVEYRPGTTILQTAREMGMTPPFSCESGSCATCMARLVEGSVRMRANNVLTDDEVAEGWVLTCQSEPTTPTVKIAYEEV